MDDPVIVHDIAQEYWYVGRTACSCGGRFQVQRQDLLTRGATPMDRLTAQCDRCGSGREFLFDISALLGRSSPVGGALGVILELGKAGDHLALDFLEDAIRHARTTGEPNREST